MKKSEVALFKLGFRLGRKYAQGQTLKEIIENAASYGEQSANGIMNFPAQLRKDQADLGINVTLSGDSVDVSPPTVEPSEVAGHYARLPDQIKKYLERNRRGFTQLEDGTTTLRWTGQSPGVAQQ